LLTSLSWWESLSGLKGPCLVTSRQARVIKSSGTVADYFQDSKQDVIELNDEDDEPSLLAMLRFCYDGIYSWFKLDYDHVDQHLTMYRLADLYDIPELRGKASKYLITMLSPVGATLKKTDEIVLLIQKVLGPNADSFADNSIQQDVYEHVIDQIGILFKNTLFQTLLADGTMFNKTFGSLFTQKVGEIVSRSDLVSQLTISTKSSHKEELTGLLQDSPIRGYRSRGTHFHI
jgi:hypothetical protein